MSQEGAYIITMKHAVVYLMRNQEDLCLNMISRCSGSSYPINNPSVFSSLKTEINIHYLLRSVL